MVRVRSHGLTRNLGVGGLARDRRLPQRPRSPTRCGSACRRRGRPKVPDGPRSVRDPARRARGLHPGDAGAGGGRPATSGAVPSTAVKPRRGRTACCRSKAATPGRWRRRKSATGRPILANDPHRAQPRRRCATSCTCNAPGLDVIGAGEPALPGVSIGHNGTIAFGLTIFDIDQEDLYVYELNPAQPDEYRYRDGWEPMRVVSETIAVQRRSPLREVELHFTRHGPVLHVDAAHDRAYALRSAWFEPGIGPVLRHASTTCARSTGTSSSARCDAGARRGENQVYADVDGQHRLGRRRADAGAAELGRPAAGARRRALRVGRASGPRRAAAVGAQPGQRLGRHGQRE